MHGSSSRVGRIFVAGQGDPTLDMTRISSVSWNLSGRVVSGDVQDLTGRVISDREVCQI